MASQMNRPELPTSKAEDLYARLNGKKVHFMVACIQLTVLFLLYSQTQWFDYVYLDDSAYVLDNFYVQSGLTIDNIHWAFTSFYMSNWHPLTWMSHMLDVSLFGTDPGWAHVHNYLLHGLNSLLLYAFILRLSGRLWISFILSLIFLVHPLHVESVAWIAERKDLLCAFFFLASLLSYDVYRTKPTALRYLNVTVTFSLALLAKPMAVTLPVIFLVLDLFVYRGRLPIPTNSSAQLFRHFLKPFVEKFPWFALSAAMCIVTIIAQHEGRAIVNIELVSISGRLLNALYAYGIYLQQMIVPVDLVIFYPLKTPASLVPLMLPSLLLLAWLALSFIYRRNYPLIAAGLLWYVITLLPVIGIIQVGSQSHADRYMYLPSIGVLIAAIYLLPVRSNRYYTLGKLVSITFAAYLSALCYWQISYWENRLTLYSHLIKVAGPSWQAHANLALAYARRSRWEQATQHGQAALDLRPNMANSYQALGDIMLYQKKYSEAEEIYMTAVNKGRINSNLLNNLGFVLAKQGKNTAALEALEGALYLDPALHQTREGIKKLRALTSSENK